MYFDDFAKHPDATLNAKLLWEYRLPEIDYQAMRDVIVQRVVERGWPNDWYFILNRYGIDGVKAAIRNVSYFNEKHMIFVSHQLGIPLTDLKCYEKKRSAPQHWNS